MMRIAILQMTAVPGDVAANLEQIETAAAQAAAGGADLLIAPELATTGYGAGDVIADLAEAAEGPQVRQLTALSEKHRLALVAGFAERDGEQLFNSLVMVDGGTAPGFYRKTHLYGDYERALFTPGDMDSALRSFHGLKLGFLICYDVEFPENVRRLARAGADAVLVPTALPQGPFAGFIAATVVPVRAFENQVFVVYANHGGDDDNFSYAGLSRAIGPDGRCLAASDTDEAALLFADIEPDAFDESRRANTYLADLRET
ncbi:carbon-nitrogen hydrolase family protein [Pelagibius litoralis]|uniref:Carbon-nitrogen hydrolase family protein n=1 Tax=Pelagibius litoralis TaxID=374515 RepID=A0A967F3U9_9PROT|nr:carbon-nitrogen hydrolase family protein [Pelagibius litoralis]NIA72518.1 carbon-nitrogen hydrolase family protein [Pelagibius litoralis]